MDLSSLTASLEADLARVTERAQTIDESLQVLTEFEAQFSDSMLHSLRGDQVEAETCAQEMRYEVAMMRRAALMDAMLADSGTDF